MQSNKRSYSKHSPRPAGAISRLLAYFMDICLGQSLFYYLLSFEAFQGHYKALIRNFKAIGWLHAWWGEGLEVLGTIVFVLIMGQLLRFYTNLIFGVSLGQWLMGIRPIGTFIWTRVGGSARTLLDTLLGPFLIFDLPCLMGKRTIKEVLSQTELTREPGSIFSNSLRAGCLMLMLVLTLYSPLLQNLTIIDGIKVAFSDGEKPSLTNQTDFNKFKSHSSNRFRFSAFSSLQDGRFILIPSFEIIRFKKRKKSRKKVEPVLIVYDKVNQVDGYLKIRNKFSLLRLLNQAKLGNPLFKTRFTQLHKTLLGGIEKYERKDYQASFGKNLLLNPLVTEEIEEVIRSSFELSLKSLLKYSFNYGPFIRGAVILRNQILGMLGKGSIPEIDITYLGDQRFLRMSQAFSGVGEERKNHLESYLPIGTNNSMILEIGWNKDVKSESSFDSFEESFLSTMNWYFDYKDAFKFPSDESEMGPMTLLDFYTKSDLSKDQIDRLEEYIFHFFFDLGREALIKNDNIMRTLLINNLTLYQKVAILRNKDKEGFFSDKYFGYLKNTKTALEERQLEYFDL